jgi:hypothetical protein
MANSEIVPNLPTDTADENTLIIIDSTQDGVLGKTEFQNVDLSILNRDSAFISALDTELRYIGALSEDSSPTLSQNLDADSNLIQNLGDPVSGSDAANKSYVDANNASTVALDGYTVEGMRTEPNGNNSVTVTSGLLLFGGVQNFSSTNFTLPAADSTDQYDLLYIDTSGNLGSRRGASRPDPQSGEFGLAYIFRPANDDSVSNSQIEDIKFYLTRNKKLFDNTRRRYVGLDGSYSRQFDVFDIPKNSWKDRVRIVFNAQMYVEDFEDRNQLEYPVELRINGTTVKTLNPQVHGRITDDGYYAWNAEVLLGSYEFTSSDYSPSQTHKVQIYTEGRAITASYQVSSMNNYVEAELI